jgi:peptidoglycan-N-acetylglucosamine deacetylase
MWVRGQADAQQVYLTFDDGPDAEWTPRVLDALAQTRAVATFFVVGQIARRAAAMVRRVVAHGHAIGNHTWSHRHPWMLSSSAARLEVRDGTSAIADTIGRQPEYYRPPHGRLRRCMVEEARECGQCVVLWSRSAIDWGPFGYAHGIAARLEKIRAGDIVLMHDGARSINKPHALMIVLPAFLASLQQRGLRPTPFTPISEASSQQAA